MKYIDKKWNTTATKRIPDTADDGEPITAVAVCTSTQCCEQHQMKYRRWPNMADYQSQQQDQHDCFVIGSGSGSGSCVTEESVGVDPNTSG